MADDVFVILVRPGPSWEPDALERRLAHLFGRGYEGEVWTSGFDIDDQEGSFRLRSIHFTDRRLLSRARFLVSSFFRGLDIARTTSKRLVFVCYDPFFSGLIGLVLARLTGGRVICEVNGTYGAAANYVSVRRAARRKQRVMLALGSWVLKRVDGVKLLYPGQLQGFDLDEARLRRWVFFDSVDSARFATAPSVEQEKVILFVGYPFALKGVDLLLSAFTALRGEFPDWRLVLVGHALEAHAERAGVEVPANTEFTGAVAPEEVAEWLDRCGVFVLPSLSEGLPRVLLEAGLKGRARVATKVGGVPHLIRDGYDGLLVDAGDEDDLRERLRAVLADADLRDRLGTNAREESLRRFTEQVYIDQYREVVDTCSRGPAPAHQ